MNDFLPLTHGLSVTADDLSLSAVPGSTGRPVGSRLSTRCSRGDGAGDFVILGHASCLEFFAATFDGDRKILTMLPNRDFPGTIG